VAVSLVDPLVGLAFLVLAVLISVGRVVVGEHYPGDVVAGALIGTGSAIVVVLLARPLIAAIARLVERITDPLLRPFWRGRATNT
jgi:undecaprenyl-diphosphatase